VAFCFPEAGMKQCLKQCLLVASPSRAILATWTAFFNEIERVVRFRSRSFAFFSV
jgi:hypothetical protein